jgi:hypothetical protein
LSHSEAPVVDASSDLNGNSSGTGSGTGSGDGPGLDLDPLLIALLKKIPSADKGWTAQTRLRWFRTFAMNASQIYDADENDPVELKIDLEMKEAAN